MRIFKIIFLLSFLLVPHLKKAQTDSTLHLSKAQWEEVSKDADYTETYREMETRTNTSSSGMSMDLSNFKYILYFLVFVLVVFLIIKVFGNFKGNSDVKVNIITIDSIREIEENLHEVNLEDLLRQALLAKKYRIALRINFLIIIKLLSQKGEIEWAREKTNWEYYTELKNKTLAGPFKEITLSFENFWYGEQPLTEMEYHLTEPSYTALQKTLSSYE